MWGTVAPVQFQTAQWKGDLSSASSILASSFPVCPQLKTKSKSLGRFILSPNWVCPCPAHRRPCPRVPGSWGSDLHGGVSEAFFPFVHQHWLLCPCVPDQDLCVQKHETGTLTSPCHLPAPTALCKYFFCPCPFHPCSIKHFSIVLYFYLPLHSRLDIRCIQIAVGNKVYSYRR